MAEVKFYYGDNRPTASAEYEGVLFFDTGTKQISRCYETTTSGTYAWEDYGGEVSIATSFPSYTVARQGVLYINSSTGAAKVYLGNGDNWATISSGALTIDTEVVSKQNDNSVPSTKAVYTAISTLETTVDGLTVNVNSSTSSSNAGKAPQLDSTGMLPTTVIPTFAISEFIGTFDSLTELITEAGTSGTAAYGAEKGDYAIIKFEAGSYNTDKADDGTYVLSGDTKTSSTSWTRISTPDTDTTYDLATTSSAGIVQPDGTTISVSSGVISAVANWRPIKVDGTSKLSDSTTSIDFVGGTNVSLSYSNGAITIAATDTTYSVATASTSGVGGTDGLMSATDKEKLNGLSVLTWQTPSNS